MKSATQSEVSLTRRKTAAALGARLFPILLVSLGACRGSIPASTGSPNDGKAAFLTRAGFLAAGQEVQGETLYLDFESSSKRYRVPFEPGRTRFLLVEPGSYRLRLKKGGVIKARAQGAEYRAELAPGSVVVSVAGSEVAPVGVLELRLLPGSEGKALARLDRSADARRKLLSEIIASMLDPEASWDFRENSLQWTRRFEEALQRLHSEGGAP